MGSRNVYLFLTRQEWIDAIGSLNARVPLYGTIRYWCQEVRYEFLDFALLPGSLASEKVSSVGFRAQALEPLYDVKDFATNSVKHGMVVSPAPALRDGSLLISVSGCKPEGRLPGVSDPGALFDLFREALMHKASRGVFVDGTGQFLKHVQYSPGALEFFDAGGSLRFSAQGGRAWIPAVRWSGK